jgi:Ca-activated chloride channel family protein
MDLRFQHPWAFVLLGIILLAFFLRKRGSFPASHFSRFPLVRNLPISFRQRLLPLITILEILTVLSIVFALARPYQLCQVPERYLGIDILLCIDTSSSMSAKDMDAKKTRLDIAKNAAKEFARFRDSDRIGLLRFARYPDLLCPPTLDHFALADWITRMKVVSSDGDEDLTGLGSALAHAALVLSRQDRPQERRKTPKVIVLLTDGRETVATPGSSEGIAPSKAALLCKQFDIRIHTIAVGRKEDGQGHNRKPYDLVMLRMIAQNSGGTNFEAGDAKTLTSIYSQIDQLEAKERDTPLFERSEKFRIFLLAALISLGLRILLGRTYLDVMR